MFRQMCFVHVDTILFVGQGSTRDSSELFQPKLVVEAVAAFVENNVYRELKYQTLLAAWSMPGVIM
jgi:hypothetical protein